MTTTADPALTMPHVAALLADLDAGGRCCVCGEMLDHQPTAGPYCWECGRVRSLDWTLGVLADALEEASSPLAAGLRSIDRPFIAAPLPDGKVWMAVNDGRTGWGSSRSAALLALAAALTPES